VQADRNPDLTQRERQLERSIAVGRQGAQSYNRNIISRCTRLKGPDEASENLDHLHLRTFWTLVQLNFGLKQHAGGRGFASLVDSWKGQGDLGKLELR